MRMSDDKYRVQERFLSVPVGCHSYASASQSIPYGLPEGSFLQLSLSPWLPVIRPL